MLKLELFGRKGVGEGLVGGGEVGDAGGELL